MGRLIDADKLYEDLANNLSSIMGDGSDGETIDTYVTIGDIIHDTFNAQPTAYDVDAVVKKLKRRSKEYNSGVRLHGKPEEMITNEAIEIVKGGGVDG